MWSVRVGADLAPNTRMNHLTVLSEGAWTSAALGQTVCDLAAEALIPMRLLDGPRVRRGSYSRRT
jgi:hypothetical protein